MHVSSRQAAGDKQLHLYIRQLVDKSVSVFGIQTEKCPCVCVCVDHITFVLRAIITSFQLLR